jgi:hypothetical protein
MAEVTIQRKYCPKCQQTLPADSFHKNKASPTGLVPYCRACFSVWSKARHARRRVIEYPPDLPGEKWRPVVEYEGLYSVSNMGRVRREKPGVRTRVGLLLRASPRGGYPAVTLFKDGRKRGGSLHILVARAFLGPCPPDYQVNHIDGVKTNPRLDNLEYETPKGNMQHAVRTGLYPAGDRNGQRLHPERVARGERNGFAKLTADAAREIRARYAQGGVSQRALAQEYGVHQQTVQRITSGRGWKHV